MVDNIYFPQPETAGTILHSRSSEYYWYGRAALSIKSVVSGRMLYQAGPAHFGVGEDEYLLLNSDQEYSVTVDAETPVETFCVFIAPGFAERVHTSLVLAPARLLDDPDARIGPSVDFVERTYSHDDVVSPALTRLRALHTRHVDEPGWLDEALHDLVIRLLQKHRGILREADHVPALRPATREELYRRLYLTKDYVTACFDQPITLDNLAGVAGLSPNHLLRTFQSLFGRTPYQYVVTVRIERAKALLATSRMPITEICFAVGWKSPGSFSLAFRRQTGFSPREYRCQFGDIREVTDPGQSE